MKNMLKKILFYFDYIRYIFVLILYKKCKKKELINKDIKKWQSKFAQIENKSFNYSLHWLMFKFPEFRNLFYYRTQEDFFIRHICKMLYRKLNTLDINPLQSIGGGLFIQHGFSSIIMAKSIGENCWINQQVTIGYIEDKGNPIVGNNVKIHAGAVVIGNITIGDNVVIGANTTVTKDVPPNCTVVGGQSYIVKKNNIKVKEKL
ncbi:hypothetical protein NL50_17430 [Clostridium acetobutylicum]|nr:hypothetical protein NL50_17430 [Clostridium acetobutylicum]